VPDLDRITADTTYVVDPDREAADRIALPYALFAFSLPLIVPLGCGIAAIAEWIR
jgi:hypothetical protein